MKLEDVNVVTLPKVEPKQVFEWVKTGKWSQKQFIIWWEAYHRYMFG